VPFHLGGGAALSGVHLRHRLSADADLFFHSRAAHRDIARPDLVEGLEIESMADLRAQKLTCLLFRSEPRDLVDLLFLDRAGYPPELDLALALKKDAGMDPGILAHLLTQFPVSPLPVMLVPIDIETLKAFRDELAERFRRSSLPET